MREAGIGRVLVASLHQGIADILPTRLGFYENWLNVEGLREGTIGLAPLYAVLSFLRQEGEAYAMITTRAGEYAFARSLPSKEVVVNRAAPSSSQAYRSDMSIFNLVETIPATVLLAPDASFGVRSATTALLGEYQQR